MSFQLCFFWVFFCFFFFLPVSKRCFKSNEGICFSCSPRIPAWWCLQLWGCYYTEPSLHFLWLQWSVLHSCCLQKQKRKCLKENMFSIMVLREERHVAVVPSLGGLKGRTKVFYFHIFPDWDFCLWKPYNPNYLKRKNTLWFNYWELAFTWSPRSHKQTLICSKGSQGERLGTTRNFQFLAFGEHFNRIRWRFWIIVMLMAQVSSCGSTFRIPVTTTVP